MCLLKKTNELSIIFSNIMGTKPFICSMFKRLHMTSQFLINWAVVFAIALPMGSTYKSKAPGWPGGGDGHSWN